MVRTLTIYRDEKEERKTLESTINKGFLATLGTSFAGLKIAKIGAELHYIYNVALTHTKIFNVFDGVHPPLTTLGDPYSPFVEIFYFLFFYFFDFCFGICDFV